MEAAGVEPAAYGRFRIGGRRFAPKPPPKVGRAQRPRRDVLTNPERSSAVGNCGHNAAAWISPVKLQRRLTIFDWLNPWWHQTFVIPVPLETDYVVRRFETETAAKISRGLDGRLIVGRRWRYLGGYLRTVATLTPNSTNTEVTVTFSRPKATIRLMVAFAILPIVVATTEAGSLVSHGLAWNWSDLGILLPFASVAVIFGANHSSALGDANHLLAEIVIALTQPPKNFWRTLAEHA